MLFDDIRKDNMTAMKERDTVKRNILGIVISKCQLVKTDKAGRGEELTDADVLLTIQKIIKEVEEESEAFRNANRLEKAEELATQANMIRAYLPKMMSEEEIKAEIAKLDDKSIPNVMKHFKTNFFGKVDMGLVNKIARG